MIARFEGRQLVQAALARHLMDTGLGSTSLRQLAAAAQVSDRMLLYYFSDKADALGAAMTQVALGLTEQLETALPAGTVWQPRALAAAAAAFTTGPAVRPYMRLWIEVVAAAARGEEPFPRLAAQIAGGFIAFVEARLDGAALPDPQATATAIVALIDGLAVIAVCGDDDLVTRTAAQLGDLL